MNTAPKITFSVFFVGILLFLPLSLFAHSQGASYEENVGEYFVDIGYSPEEPYTGGTTDFSFSLLKDDVSANFSDIWVRISKENKTVFAGGIHNSKFGGARLSLTLPEAGEYTVSSRYQDGNEEIASVEFPILVSPSADGNQGVFGLTQILYILVGIFVGAFGILFITKKK